MLTPKTFVEELLKRRKGIPEHDLVNLAALATEVTPETLGAMLGSFDNYYTSDKTPGRADIIRCAEKAGIKISKMDRNFYYQVCEKCGAKYSMESPGCPICRKVLPVKIGAGRRKPEGYIALQENCFLCRHFRINITGAICESYGKGEGIEQCRECPCRRCCSEKNIIKTNYKAYKKMLENGQTEDRRL